MEHASCALKDVKTTSATAIATKCIKCDYSTECKYKTNEGNFLILWLFIFAVSCEKKKEKGTVQRGECRKNEEWKRHG